MADAIDLDLYLERIDWRGGALTPSEDVLASLVRAHVSHVAFENLDVLLGRGVSLEIGALEDKLVRRRRGGYCFEHGTLFAAVLARIGFVHTPHLARVVHGRAREASPRTHMLLRVELGGRTFLADPGYGQAARLPLPLEDGLVLRDGAEVYRLAREGRAWVYRTGEDASAHWLTDLGSDEPMDFVVGNHFTSTSPVSSFKNHLMLRAWTPEGARIGVYDREVTVWRDGVPERRTLADRRELRAFVATHAAIDLPEVETLVVPAVEGWG